MRYVIHISISVQYLVFLYEYLKERRKNPQWSFSCCLALLLPVNDLQGEIRGMVGKNLMKTQLDKGILKKPSIAAAALESGAMRFTLCPEELQSEDEREEQFVKDNVKKFHRWTQTEGLLPTFSLKVESGLTDSTKQTTE